MSLCLKTKKIKLIFEINHFVYITEEQVQLLLGFRTFRLKKDFKISAKSQAPCFGGRLVCVASFTSARATRGDLYQPCFISKSHTNMLKLKSDSLSSKDSFQVRHNLIILLILLIKYCFAARKVHTQLQPGKYQVTRSQKKKKKK